jgi:TolB-like protein/tetratricopeptide (TPR) repeat protein
MRRTLLNATLFLTAGLSANGQCPDGSPPPCRTRPATPAVAVASAPRRTTNPPLNDATWIVLPFDNLAKAPDVEWLRDASVNLLYLDLSKWSDIRVVDDERVADLLREVPGAQGKQLSLADGLAVAKRAGAGRLVMGDVLKIGSTTAVTAKVFDVRGGQRIRTVRQESAVQDSLMPSFGKLARGILNVAPPTGANVGEIGTTNTAAYQDYLAGVHALNAFDLKTAHRHFDAALAKDSTFALAHYKLAVLIGWENPNDDAKAAHAKAAARFSGALPPRERTLVNGLVAFDNTEFGRACGIYGSLIHPDSSDVEALYGMGECLFHDNVVEAIGGDTTRLRYRGSYNAAVSAFRRTLEIDPTYHLAFQHILDIYVNEGRSTTGCRLKDTTALKVDNAAASCADTYTSVSRVEADTLVLIPVSVKNSGAIAAQTELARRTNSRQNKIKKAQAYALAWADAGPTESRALMILAGTDLMLGDLVGADTLMPKVRVAELTDAEQGRMFTARLELAWKRARDGEVVRTIDSIAATHPAGQAGSYTAISLASLGRMAALDSLIRAQLGRSGAPPVALSYYMLLPRVAVGAVPEGVVAAERAFFDAVKSGGAVQGGVRTATAQTLTTTMFGLRFPRQEWPAVDSTLDHRLLPALALARKDTAALRLAANTLDSAARVAADSRSPDDGTALIAADAFLVLGDSTAALTAVRRFLDRGIDASSIYASVSPAAFQTLLWPRALLLRADLEAAKGDKQVARTYYRRFLTLWAKADPELQPIVDRARKSLAALGPG